MRKKAFKKVPFVALSVGLVFSLMLSGCGNSGNNAQGSGATSSGTGNSATTAPKGDPVTLKIEVFDRGNSPQGMTVTNNRLTQYVQKNFGDPNNIKVEFVPVPRSQELDKLNVLMATSDAPDIVFTYHEDLVYKYVTQGGLTDLGPLLDQYGPDLKKYLGADTLAYGVFDGKQYAIPAKRVYLGKYASLVRQDWLDKLNLKVPQTTDDTLKVLEALKKSDPAGGGKTIPLGFSLAQASYEPIISTFLKPQGFEKALVYSYPAMVTGNKEGVQFINKLYNEGLLSPDWALDKDKKKLQQDVMTGAVGMYSEDAGNSYYLNSGNPGVIQTLEQNVKGATLTPTDAFTDESGKHTKPGYQPSGMDIMVPKTSKHAAEAMKYLNWMAQKENLWYMSIGVEGKNYQMVDGVPTILTNDDTKTLLYNAGDMAIISNGLDYGSKDLNLKADSLVVPEQLRAGLQQARAIGLQDGVPPVRLSHPLQSDAKYGKLLGDKYQELLVKSIMAKPADFSATYDALMKDYMASGGDQVKKDFEAAYNAMQK